MANRMETTFQAMAEKGEKILVAYYPLCDPLIEDQVAWAGTYFENGATVLEMGIPYVDPVLDGATVRASMARALEEHDVSDAFKVIAELRAAYPDNILQVMTYYEIIDQMGIEEFAKACAQAGADGVLSPNTPAEVVPALDEALSKHGLINLRFSPYHLTPEAEEDLKQNARGYIFQQAVDGATGAQPTVSPQIGVNVKRLKSLGITTPVVAGFGISNGEQVAEAIGMGADGCIVGSAILTAIEKGNGAEFIKSLRDAM